MATSVSPDLGTHRHPWIAPYKRDRAHGAKRRAVAKIRPDLDDAELDVLVTITNQQEIDQYLQQMGDQS